MMSECYVPDLARGVRWNDPAFGITWPIQEIRVSPRDLAFPDFTMSLAAEASAATRS